MKSTSKLVLTSLVLGAAALMTGCESVPSGTDPLYSRNNQGFNAAGLVDWSPESYEKINAVSNDIHTNDIYDRKDISGDNLSLFWGSLVIADY